MGTSNALAMPDIRNAANTRNGKRRRNVKNSIQAHAADAKKPGISRLIHDNTFYSAVTLADDVRPPRLSLRLGLLQIAKELAIWIKHQHIALARKTLTVRPQATIKSVELLIQAIGLGVDRRR